MEPQHSYRTESWVQEINNAYTVKWEDQLIRSILELHYYSFPKFIHGKTYEIESYINIVMMTMVVRKQHSAVQCCTICNYILPYKDWLMKESTNIFSGATFLDSRNSLHGEDMVGCQKDNSCILPPRCTASWCWGRWHHYVEQQSVIQLAGLILSVS